MNRFNSSFAGSLITLTVLAFNSSSAAAVGEPAVVTALNQLRNIAPAKNQSELKNLNQRIDSTWRFLEQNRTEASPIVVRELRKSLEQKLTDQLFILETAFFLVARGQSLITPGNQDLALDALEHIRPESEIIQNNFVELAKFTHALAKLGNSRVLPQIDRIFLDSDRGIEFYESPYYVKLEAHPLRVLLYGATGPSVEDYLAKLLENRKYESQHFNIITTLGVLGSERTAVAVVRQLDTQADEQFAVAVSMLMSVGGPSGRDAVLGVRPDRVSAKSRELLQRIHPAVEAMSFELQLNALKQLDRSARVFNDAELLPRLERYAQSGIDTEVNPTNVLTSTIPKPQMLALLKRTRSRVLWTLSQHAYEEMEYVNYLIKAIQYKPQERESTS